MSNKKPVFDSLVKGLEEAVKDAEAEKKFLKRTSRTIFVSSLKNYSKKDVKQIRNDLGMSLKVFASCLGVSQKTVEAWESGKNTPSGSSSRLLSLFEMNNNLAEEYAIITYR